MATMTAMAIGTNEVPQMPGFVIVLIRFPLHRVDACRNALMKNYSVNKAYAGLTSGVSRRIQSIEGGWPDDKGLAVLLFCSHKEAELWKDSVPEIRQPDWLDGVDLIIVPLRCHPPEDFKFVQLLDMRVFECEQFEKWSNETNVQLEGLSDTMAPAVVACRGAQKVKGSWEPGFLQLNFWKTSEDFQQFYCTDVYRKWMESCCAWADIKSCIFELEPLCLRFC